MEPSTAEARSAVCGDGRAQSASVDAVGNAKLCQCEQAKALCPGLPVTGGVLCHHCAEPSLQTVKEQLLEGWGLGKTKASG